MQTHLQFAMKCLSAFTLLLLLQHADASRSFSEVFRQDHQPFAHDGAHSNTKLSNVRRSTIPKTIKEFVEQDENFSIIFNLFAKAELLDALDELPSLDRRRGQDDDLEPPLTIALPTNTAFDAIDTDATFLASGDFSYLRETLLHHIIQGVFTLSDLKQLGSISAASGSVLTIAKQTGAGVYFEDKHTNRAYVQQEDIFVTNGVIHTINALFLAPDVRTCAVDDDGNLVPGGQLGLCECGVQESDITSTLNMNWVGVFCAECPTDPFCDLDVCVIDSATGKFVPEESRFQLCDCLDDSVPDSISFSDLNTNWQQHACDTCEGLAECPLTTTTPSTTETPTSPEPIDCIVTEWFCMSGVVPGTGDCACSQDCNGGFYVKIRLILQAAAYGGASCPVLFHLEPCNTHPCTTSPATTKTDDGATVTLPEAAIGSTAVSDDTTWLVLIPILAVLFIIMCLILGCPICCAAGKRKDFGAGQRHAAINTDSMAVPSDGLEYDMSDMYTGGSTSSSQGLLVSNAMYSSTTRSGEVITNALYGKTPSQTSQTLLVDNSAYGEQSDGYYGAATWSSNESNMNTSHYDIIPGAQEQVAPVQIEPKPVIPRRSTTIGYRENPVYESSVT